MENRSAGPLLALSDIPLCTAHKGFPHGMPATNADTINADLLAFLRSGAPAKAKINELLIPITYS